MYYRRQTSRQKQVVRIRIHSVQLQADVDQKALVSSRNRVPSIPYPGRPGGWRRS